MALYRYRPVANGLRTDHPIPDLMFVDDDHIPLEDPVAIEAIGRRKGPDMHGRHDRCKDGGWVAITTDPYRHELAWLWDGAAEQYYRRPVPAAVTVTVPDQPPGGDPGKARILTVTNVGTGVTWRGRACGVTTSHCGRPT